ncbi:MAG TPA: UDP-N-acetylglucosamine 2-epimerase (non-hydrolyzing) [Acetobacteraceae bacterium]|nr:UDP-N-acetylglucosamine 2-epimerase (non-hydrolyzing) [Acetobacteraceae bacterium]
MRIATLFGTRPEIIRLSLLMKLLDAAGEHVTIHTGQNFDPRLSDLFFDELGLRAPDHHLGIRETGFAAQAGAIIAAAGALLERLRPDRLLILGDTNSALAALPAKRLGIPVVHMEAGNRCHDERVPEELNRRIVDHASDLLLPYTERSRQNLLREGIHPARIHVTGNPIAEVLEANRARIEASGAGEALGLAPRDYLLATLHRAENVDDPRRLPALIEGLAAAARDHGVPALLSAHPRTRARLQASGLAVPSQVILAEPFGFADFVALERDALCVLTDSGTVQEECAILRVPNVTLRDTTERPETLDCGSNILAGAEPESIRRTVRVALTTPRDWPIPAEYARRPVAATVLRLLHGRLPPEALR